MDGDAIEAQLSRNIRRNTALVQANAGPELVIIVCGRESDRRGWQARFDLTKSELFRADGATTPFAVSETTPKGNFLGMLRAWVEVATRRQAEASGEPDGVAFMSMLFGQGTRLSPFTQALGNSKPRFPTPYKSQTLGRYLSIGELSALYTNWLVDHLRTNAFRGLVVKWGDEVIIPSVDLARPARDYAGVDAVRFVSRRRPTADLAREKEWVLFDGDSGLMLSQLSRQPLEGLLKRVESRQRSGRGELGVNLGSLAVSSDFMRAAVEVFGHDLDDPDLRLDWDPYVWMALSCDGPEAWAEEIAYDESIGQGQLRAIDNDYPRFFPKITEIKRRLEDLNGRRFAVRVLDFGEPLWLDLGQHLALRQNLSALLEDSMPGRLLRELFRLPAERDARGNTIIDSAIHPAAQVRDSLVLDSRISSGESVVNRGVIIDSRFGHVDMREGGIALFSDAREVTFDGPHGVLFDAVEPTVSLPAGGRQTTLVTPSRTFQLRTNEAQLSYKGKDYDEPVQGNEIPFAEAAKLAGDAGLEVLDELRTKAAAAVRPQ